MALVNIDPKRVEEAEQLARQVAAPVTEFIDEHTTTSVERSCCRLLGIEGVDEEGIPLANRLVDEVKEKGLLGSGISWWLANGWLQTGKTPAQLAQAVAEGEMELTGLSLAPLADIRAAGRQLAAQALFAVRQQRQQREDLIRRWGEGARPWLYVIVATGNIYEDVEQAQAAAEQGADIIAVIRSTGQSLLDYVPHGPTTEGYGGTYATQANFRIMRHALDEASAKSGRYVRLVNYCSGLCMPEIAALGALERLDMMLNDAMYGILFRDINMQRTLIDQSFSRLINGYAGAIINTGEDNYLTTDDAVRAHHTVLASQFINLEFARASGMDDEQVGLGHAFQVSPQQEDALSYELAMAALVRGIFPQCPIKFMPPTRHKTGNIFQDQVLDSLFDLVSVTTGQDIHLLGILTEAIHTPYLQDRYLAIKGAQMVMNAGRSLGSQLCLVPGALIQERADAVLSETVDFLAEVAEKGLWTALEQGMFAQIVRHRDGGKGLDGVVKRSEDYFNPLFDHMWAERRDGHERA